MSIQYIKKAGRRSRPVALFPASPVFKSHRELTLQTVAATPALSSVVTSQRWSGAGRCPGLDEWCRPTGPPLHLRAHYSTAIAERPQQAEPARGGNRPSRLQTVPTHNNAISTVSAGHSPSTSRLCTESNAAVKCSAPAHDDSADTPRSHAGALLFSNLRLRRSEPVGGCDMYTAAHRYATRKQIFTVPIPVRCYDVCAVPVPVRWYDI